MRGIISAVKQRFFEKYPSLHAGELTAVNSWLYLQREAMRGLKGIFTRDDIYLLITIIEPISFSPSLAIEGYPLIPKLKGKNIYHKIKALSPFHLFFLIEYLSTYWVFVNRNRFDEQEKLDYLEALL